MAETGGGGGGVRGCNQTCGCAVPCPGGRVCKCATAGGEEVAHRRCSCGEHCGCNPCTCPSAVTGVGKNNCRCGDNCRCESCAC